MVTSLTSDNNVHNTFINEKTTNSFGGITTDR